MAAQLGQDFAPQSQGNLSQPENVGQYFCFDKPLLISIGKSEVYTFHPSLIIKLLANCHQPGDLDLMVHTVLS